MVNEKKQKSKDLTSNSIWFLLFGVVFTNLYFDTNSADPFNTPKLISIVLIASWLTGHLLKSIVKEIKTRNQLEKLFFLLIISFISSLLISTFLSDNLVRAVIGDTQRRNGFIAYLSLSIIFLYSIRFFNFKYAIRIYKVAILNGSLFSIYALLQTSGNDFISWNNPYNSIIGTVGNPNFASAIMAVFILLGLGSLRINEVPGIYKFAAILMSLMCFLGIVLSNSRQGLVSLFFALGIYFVIWIYIKRKILGVIIGFMFCISSGFAILGMLQKGPLTSFLYKTSVTIRGYYWDAGIQMFKSNILTGVGVDSYGSFFKEYRSVEYPIKYGFDITSSNAHNVFIQFFATAGVFVGAIYLILVLLIGINGLKLVKYSSQDQFFISLGLFSGWIAFQAQAIISIDNIGISIWGWVLGGAIIALRSSQIESEKYTNFRALNSKILIDPFQTIISGLILIPMLVLTLNLHTIETDLLKLRSYPLNLNQEQTLYLTSLSEKLLSNPLSDPYYKLDAISTLFNFGQTEKSLDYLNLLIKTDIRNNEAIGFKADIEANRNNFAEAIKLREIFALRDPWNAKNYLALIQLNKKIDNNLNAERYFQKILSFAPHSKEFEQAKNLIQN